MQLSSTGTYWLRRYLPPGSIPVMEPKGISRREYARRRGINEKSIRKHLQSGLLAGAVLPDGTLDQDAADRLLADHVTRGQRTPATLAAARHRKQKASTALIADAVAGQRLTTVGVGDVRTVAVESARIIATRLRKIPDEAAPLIAGKSAQETQRALKAVVHSALVDISGDAGPENGARTPASESLDNLSPTQLAARRATLQAEVMEIERAIQHGAAMTIELAAEMAEARYAVVKSLITALPSYLDTYASVAEARASIAARIERAVAELQCDFVTAEDLADA